MTDYWQVIQRNIGLGKGGRIETVPRLGFDSLVPLQSFAAIDKDIWAVWNHMVQIGSVFQNELWSVQTRNILCKLDHSPGKARANTKGD